MRREFSAVVLLISALIIYTAINSFLTKRRHARQAAKLGCKPAKARPYKLPLALDAVWELMEADKRGQLAAYIVAIREEIRVDTWDQKYLGTTFYTTADPKNIQALLATQFNDFAIGEIRRKNFFPFFGNGIFTSDGKEWEHSRAMLRPQFARDQISDLELEEVHVQDLLKHLPTDDVGWTSTVDLKPLLFNLTLDSATEFLFGKSVNSQMATLSDASAQYEGAAKESKLDWTSFGPAFDSGTMVLGIRGRLNELYWLYSPPSFWRDCKQVHKFADYYVDLALKSDLSTRKEDGLKKRHASKKKYVFLQELVAATRDPVELRSQLLNILVAGRDTTAGLLGYFFYVMARHPDVYHKLRKVILDTFGTYDRPHDITFANLKACIYLQHNMNEILRLYPSAPFNSRTAVRDTTLPRGGGPDGSAPLYVWKGQEVSYSVHVMHRRKDLWGEDAEEFKPERWVGRKPGWEFLPFNGGPRICLGQQFALTEAGYIIVRLMQKYDKIVNEDPSTVERHAYGVTTAPVSVLVRLHEASE